MLVLTTTKFVSAAGTPIAIAKVDRAKAKTLAEENVLIIFNKVYSGASRARFYKDVAK